MTTQSRSDEALLLTVRDALLADAEDAQLTTLENEAVQEAAMAVGEWCAEAVGHFDFAAMDENARAEFLRRLIVGYRHALRRRIADQPPF